MQNTIVTPEWAVWLVGLLLTWLMTNGLKALSKSVPWIPAIEGQAAAVTAAALALVISAFNSILGTLPVDVVPAVDAVFKFVAMLLSAYGVHYTVKQFAPQK